MGYNQIDTVLMMSYYTIARALHQLRKKRLVVCDIKEEGGHKELSKYISTMSVQAIFDKLFKYKTDITYLYDIVHFHYLDLGPHQDHLDGCVLECVTVYKRRALISHESILFTLRSKYDGGKEFQLLVERTVDILSALGLSSKDPSSTKYANDSARMVKLVAGTDTLSHKSYGEPMWTLLMPPANSGFKINLVQLFGLLQALRRVDRGQEYNAIDRNCFWLVRMARLVILRLAQRAGVQVTPKTTDEAEARLGTCSCVRLDGTRSHNMDEMLVDRLINKFEADYKDFKQRHYASCCGVLRPDDFC